MNRLSLPYVLLLLLFCAPVVIHSSIANVGVDFSQTIKTTSPNLFGLVDNNLDPSAGSGDGYLNYMASMNIRFIRVVSQLVTQAWYNNGTQSWAPSKISNYFDRVRIAYSAYGHEMPEFMVNCKQPPLWMVPSERAALPVENYGNYSQFCAELVKIVNIDLQLNVRYWQPFNNLDAMDAYRNNLPATYEIFKQTTEEMKKIDPSIITGPSYAGGSEPQMGLIYATTGTNVDFLHMHFYSTTDLTQRTTEKIFEVGQTASRYNTHFSSLIDLRPDLPIIVDEFGLHNGPTDSRLATNIAAVWLAQMHIFYANRDKVTISLYYNAKSNSVGIIDNTNTRRPSSHIAEWTNKYFVGDISRSSSEDSNLQIFAVKSNDDGMRAVYIVNSHATNASFTFQNFNTTIADLKDDFYFLRNTVNESGWYENEITEEWRTGLPSYTVAAYSVTVLHFNESDLIRYVLPTEAPTVAPETPAGLVCQEDPVTGRLICKEAIKPRKFNTALSAGLGAFVGVGVIVAVFAILILAFHWDTFTKRYGTFYCSVIISGVLFGLASALSLLPRPSDGLCVLFPWLLGIGFNLVYGCLFIKTWILYRLWRHAMQLKKMYITATTVLKYVGASILIELILLIVWTVVDPPHLKTVELVDDTFQEHCHSDTPTFWIIFISLKGAWLLFGAVITILTRDIIKEYNDFSSIAYAIYNNFILLAIAIPLALVLEKVGDAVKLISLIVIVLAFTFTLIILFYETWLTVLFPNSHIPAGITAVRNKTSAMTSSTNFSSGGGRSSHSHSNENDKSSSQLSSAGSD